MSLFAEASADLDLVARSATDETAEPSVFAAHHTGCEGGDGSTEWFDGYLEYEEEDELDLIVRFSEACATGMSDFILAARATEADWIDLFSGTLFHSDEGTDYVIVEDWDNTNGFWRAPDAYWAWSSTERTAASHGHGQSRAVASDSGSQP